FYMMVGAYVLLSFFTRYKYLAGLISIAFTLTSFNMIGVEVGHTTKMLSFAFLLISMGGLFRIFNRQYWVGSALYLFGLMLGLYSGHVQIVYYAIIAFLIVTVAKAIPLIRAKQYKDLLVTGSVIFGVTLVSL